MFTVFRATEREIQERVVSFTEKLCIIMISMKFSWRKRSVYDSLLTIYSCLPQFPIHNEIYIYISIDL
ncbi:hypothetical protein GIB67_013985, partial [Kingdonia uniflora]